MELRSAMFAVTTSAAAVAVTLLASGPSAAGAPGMHLADQAGALVGPSAHLTKKQVCFDNLGDASQVGIVSQSTGSGTSPLDAPGADDFHLSSRCRVSTVAINGMVFNGVADSFEVTFYKNKQGLPGKALATVTSNQIGTCTPPVVCDTAIALPTPVMLKKSAGWVSVQATMDFGEGQFVWITRLTQTGRPAVWENPDDGWGTGCTTWQTLQTCWGALNPGPDFEFALLR
jgi:hypothetical protein